MRKNIIYVRIKLVIVQNFGQVAFEFWESGSSDTVVIGVVLLTYVGFIIACGGEYRIGVFVIPPPVLLRPPIPGGSGPPAALIKIQKSKYQQHTKKFIYNNTLKYIDYIKSLYTNNI